MAEAPGSRSSSSQTTTGSLPAKSYPAPGTTRRWKTYGSRPIADLRVSTPKRFHRLFGVRRNRHPARTNGAASELRRRPAPVFGNVPHLALAQRVRIGLIEGVPDVGLMTTARLELGGQSL